MPESSSPGAPPRGLQFTPAQARNLLLALIILGTGVLTWLKTLMSQREPAQAAPPEKTISEEIFAPYRALEVPSAPPAETIKKPEMKRAPAAAPKSGEKVYEVELE